MTALARYKLLESEARYFDGASARPRDVILRFGERSLVIIGADDVALAHWPLAGLRAIGDRGDATLQIAPGRESEERLLLGEKLMISAIEEVCPDLYQRKVGARGLRKIALWSGGAIASALLIVFVIIPALAATLAGLIPPEREQALGEALSGQILDLLAYGQETDAPPLCSTPDGDAALARMIQRIQGDLALDYPLHLDVVDNPLVNALALPGGHMMLFRGLIEAAETPEEVAGVLAHEIGHVAHRDPTEHVLRAAGTAGILGMLLGDVFGAGLVVAATETAMNASYQREAEARADEMAVRLLAAAELPSRPFANFFRKISDRYGDVPEVLQYFASHPGLEGRALAAEAADSIGERPFDPVLSDRDWVALREICGTE